MKPVTLCTVLSTLLFILLFNPANAQILQLNWAKSDGNANVYARQATTDNNGNVWAIALGDDQSNHQMILYKYTSAGTAALSPIYVNNAIARSIVADGSGNVIIAGQIAGTATFGSYSLTSTGINDAFIVKYDASGNCIWAHSLQAASGGSSSSVFAMAIEGGNIFITGPYIGTVDFDPDVSTSNLTSAGSADGFIAKYSASDCSFTWAKSFGGTGADAPAAIAVDVTGTIYVTGAFSGTANFNTGGSPSNLVSNGGQDIFVARYAANGNFFWADGFGGTLDDIGNQILVDGNNVYVTGSFNGTANFNPTGTANLTSNGSNDIFVARYSASGGYGWAHNLGGTGDDRGWGLTLDNAGNLYATGQFTGTANFDPAGTANLTSAGGTDAYIAKYSANGDYFWAQALGGTGNEVGMGILYANNHLYAVGSFENTVDFDPSSATFNLISTGLTDAYVTSFDDLTTGIADKGTQQLNATIYPNPANNILNISLDNEQAAMVKIFSSTGQLIAQQYATGHAAINVSDFAAGTYYAQITTTHTSTNFKFVKQ